MENWYYKVYFGNKNCAYYRRSDAFNCYLINNGYKIEIITKDLHPTITTIVDCAGFNLERLRKDFTIKMTSEALRKAVNKYDKEHTKQIALKLNKTTDADILDYLEQQKNKQGTIKEAIREYIKNHKDCETFDND